MQFTGDSESQQGRREVSRNRVTCESLEQSLGKSLAKSLARLQSQQQSQPQASAALLLFSLICEHACGTWTHLRIALRIYRVKRLGYIRSTIDFSEVLTTFSTRGLHCEEIPLYTLEPSL